MLRKSLSPKHSSSSDSSPPRPKPKHTLDAWENDLPKKTSWDLFSILAFSNNTEANQIILDAIPQPTFQKCLTAEDAWFPACYIDPNTFIHLLNKIDDPTLDTYTRKYDFLLLQQAALGQAHEVLRVLLLRLSPFLVAKDNLMPYFLLALCDNAWLSYRETLQIAKTYLEIRLFVLNPELFAKNNQENFLAVLKEAYFSPKREILVNPDGWRDFLNTARSFLTGSVKKEVEELLKTKLSVKQLPPEPEQKHKPLHIPPEHTLWKHLRSLDDKPNEPKRFLKADITFWARNRPLPSPETPSPTSPAAKDVVSPSALNVTTPLASIR